VRVAAARWSDHRGVRVGAVAEHVGWPAGFALLALLAAAGWRLLAPLQAQERAGWSRPQTHATDPQPHAADRRKPRTDAGATG
jgi:hypothetical protein